MISSVGRGVVLREQVRAFTRKSLAELSAAASESVERDLYLRLGKAGWLGIGLPRAAGGQGGTGIDWTYVVAGLASSAPEHVWAWALLQSVVRGPILRLGRAEIKRELLPLLASGEARACVGFTEPDAGADVASIKTVARKTEHGYRVTGSKLYTDAGSCTHMLITTLTDPRGTPPTAISLFIVPLDTDGITIRPIKMSFHSDRYEINFEDVFLDSRYRLGDEGRGWEHFTTTVRDYEWTESRPVGRAANFVRQLVDFERQAGFDQRSLATAALIARVFGARVAQFRAIQMRDSDETVGPLIEPAIAKLYSAETTKAILEEAVFRAGVDGLYDRGSGAVGAQPMRGRSPLFARFLPSLVIAGWPSEIQREVIAQRLWPRD